MSGEKSKTDTIKQRRVDVYLPSIDMKKKWKEVADERGQSLSKFVIELVEDSLNREDEDYESRQELLEENRELKEKIKELEKDVKVYRESYDKLEEELKEHRAKDFTESGGSRKFSKELIQLLKKERFVEFEDIYDKLDIDPSDTEMVKAFQEQLKTLEEYGLVKEEDRGWRWQG